ncbi:MAG TPA: nitrogenase molybdenum-iron protein alpha chain [Fibrobacteraceae bacterium]|nr:nitrogenase molybdenum-iron protein alpha chain [Fibrobacteraceae bacterium]
MSENTFENTGVFKEDLLKIYPAKVARKRNKAVQLNDPQANVEIQANVRTIPGIITQRGCTYAGCKGVVLGPTRDIVNLVHGPIGCSFYAWLTRRNQTDPGLDGPNYMTYAFSTDLQDENIVFGGEKKLKEAIREVFKIFKPKAIGIFSTCPVGLIGDDVHAVARDMEQELEDQVNIFGFSCEGYKGVSQSAGHHIANNGLFKHVIGLDDTDYGGKFKFNLLGEYNIGGDEFELARTFNDIGMTLVSTFSGNSSYHKFANSHTVDLNAVMCHRSINYVAEMMEKKYGIPWMKVNLIGSEATAKSLRKMAKYFDDKELTQRTEEVISKEMAEVEKVRQEVFPRTQGKTAMLFVGGSRAHHYQELFRELGMEVVAAGYEFAHRDDYEGRRVLPTLKVDADSRNIEELKVGPDETRYRPRKTEEQIAKLNEEFKASGDELMSDYRGMMSDMSKGSLSIDDISHREMEKLIEMYHPSVFCAGIKEKYAVQKMGVPLKQLHSYDYGGPYAGFRGAINFYREIDRMVNSNVWHLIQAPWDKAEPTLSAGFVA